MRRVCARAGCRKVEAIAPAEAPDSRDVVALGFGRAQVRFDLAQAQLQPGGARPV
jgi:hypothetical protein